MKFLTLKHATGFTTGVLMGEDVLDLEGVQAFISDAKTIPGSMREVIAGGDAVRALVGKVIDQASEASIAAQLRDASVLKPYETASLGPVVPNPNLVLSGSMNSWGHLEEMGDVKAEHPCAFIKFPSSLSCSGADILLPPGHDQMVDWEGELCVVIGKRCHQVSREEADDYIYGYTLMNDVSAREFAMEFIQSGGKPPVAIVQAWERNVLGKNFPTFCPVGPLIATKDELPTPFTYLMETVVNGEVMQSSTEKDLVFDPWEMISYFSEFLTFEPGDIISMGSPPGVGMARDPQVFLKSGDVVEVRSEALGVLRNTVSSKA